MRGGKHRATVERYFRGLYAGDTTVVDDLTGENIVVSYPNFAMLFGTPALHGRDELKALCRRFSQRWADPHVEFHEFISEGDTLVVVWSFRARNVTSVRPGEPATNEEHQWGGISLFRFDGDGKIVAEIGEESTPGPMQRVQEWTNE